MGSFDLPDGDCAPVLVHFVGDAGCTAAVARYRDCGDRPVLSSLSGEPIDTASWTAAEWESLEAGPCPCSLTDVRRPGLQVTGLDTTGDGTADLCAVIDTVERETPCPEDGIVWDNPSPAGTGLLVNTFATVGGVTGTATTSGSALTGPVYNSGLIHVDLFQRATAATAVPDHRTVFDFDVPVNVGEFSVRSVASNEVNYSEDQIVRFYHDGQQVLLAAPTVVAGTGTYDAISGYMTASLPISPEFELLWAIDQPVDQIVVEQQPTATADNIGIRLSNVCAAFETAMFLLDSVTANPDRPDLWIPAPVGDLVDCPLTSATEWRENIDCTRTEYAVYTAGCVRVWSEGATVPACATAVSTQEQCFDVGGAPTPHTRIVWSDGTFGPWEPVDFGALAPVDCCTGAPMFEAG